MLRSQQEAIIAAALAGEHREFDKVSVIVPHVNPSFQEASESTLFACCMTILSACLF